MARKDIGTTLRHAACGCAMVFGIGAVDCGSALAESRHLCEQDVKFELATPDAKTPSDMAAFQGVWLGKIDALCSALIVENVAADGSVTAIYVNGTYGPWRITQPGNYRTKGKIKDGVLTINLPNASEVQYKITGQNTLGGTYVSRGYNYPGSFVKQ
jgi:hypothetical protein